MKTVEDVKAHNMKVYMRHGPGLNGHYRTFVIARDPYTKRILIGGLGSLGVGQMWFDEKDTDRDRIGYKEARIVAGNTENDMMMFDGNMRREFERLIKQ